MLSNVNSVIKHRWVSPPIAVRFVQGVAYALMAIPNAVLQTGIGTTSAIQQALAGVGAGLGPAHTQRLLPTPGQHCATTSPGGALEFSTDFGGPAT